MFPRSWPPSISARTPFIHPKDRPRFLDAADLLERSHSYRCIYLRYIIQCGFNCRAFVLAISGYGKAGGHCAVSIQACADTLPFRYLCKI